MYIVTCKNYNFYPYHGKLRCSFTLFHFYPLFYRTTTEEKTKEQL